MSLVHDSAMGQSDKLVVGGKVTDSESGEGLIGVTILVKELKAKGVITDANGEYRIALPKGNYTLSYNFIGYETINQSVSGSGTVQKNVSMSLSSSELDEVVVKAEREDKNVRSTTVSVVSISPKDLEDVPVLFGEKDVLKTIQLMPGVQSAGEGSSGFYVRGGDAGQNLLLLDEATVYNASHLMGFFSVFNSEALEDVNLYKGGIPAQYGGRISSVMDVRMRESSVEDFGGAGGIGLISSNLMLETPFDNNKGSVFVAGRRTYADVFTAFSNDPAISDTKLYFYDLNMKADYKINDNNRVYVSGYLGEDRMGITQFGLDWGNKTATLGWDHAFNDHLYMNTSLVLSNYDYNIKVDQINISSTINTYTFKQQYDWGISDNFDLKFGWDISYSEFGMGDLKASDDSGMNDFNVPDRITSEGGVFVSANTRFSDKLFAEYGIRYSGFAALGEGTFHTFDDEGDVINSEYYGKGEIAQYYGGLEPRINVTYMLTETSSLKASYNRMRQYNHLLSNSGTSLPTDLWIPSSNNIAPEIGDQVSLGYYRNFSDNKYEFSTEAYYKEMKNVIDYRTGAELGLNEYIEGDLLYGDGRAYGLEMYVKKKTGRLTGWISYTLSKSERQFDDIDGGVWFPSRQDRRHDFSITSIYKINERMKLSANWVYYTGNAITYPSGKYYINGQPVPYYSERNGYRMPDYHRLDIGLNIENKNYKIRIDPETGKSEKVNKRVESGWNFSLYNAYGRKNAYMITFEEKEGGEEGEMIANKISLFSFLPSVSYYFRF